MLTKNFCTALEFAISGALTKAQEKNWRRYWCDGVLSPDEQLNSIEKVKATGKIETTAYMPKGAYQDQKFTFQMIIWLGEQSFPKYLVGDDLMDCIPETEPEEWIRIDEEKRVVEIGLL